MAAKGGLLPITNDPTGDFYWQIPATERGLLKELTGAEGALLDVVAERDKAEVARWAERVAEIWVALGAGRPGWMASPVDDTGLGAALLADRGPELAVQFGSGSRPTSKRSIPSSSLKPSGGPAWR